jgi:heptaprenylglyceryl phosphate synthase
MMKMRESVSGLVDLIYPFEILYQTASSPLPTPPPEKTIEARIYITVCVCVGGGVLFNVFL